MLQETGCQNCVTIILFSPEFILLLKLWLVVFYILPPAKEDPFVNSLLNFTFCCLGTLKKFVKSHIETLVPRFHLTLSLPVVASTGKKMPVRIYVNSLMWKLRAVILWLLLLTFLFTPAFSSSSNYTNNIQLTLSIQS